MRFPGKLQPAAFLAQHWQKSALSLPGALPDLDPALTAGELAWLATQQDVESRLVFTRRERDGARYEVRHGPFENDVLSSLPRQDWTLLVQDVEKHLPAFRQLFQAVDFVPDWRIDDLMVSFAAPGGSVGPHRDNYDVFLCQGEGRREWRLAGAGAVAPADDGGDLDLLQPFDDSAPLLHESGDVLYLPPGVPHWGIARDFCMTYSIGMRAPNVAELNAGLARLPGLPPELANRSSARGSDVFYSDPDLEPSEAEPGCISEAAVERARKLLETEGNPDRWLAAKAIGSAVTDPKAWLEPDGADDDDIHAALSAAEAGKVVEVHGMAKLAWHRQDSRTLLFANGHVLETASDALQLFGDICKFRTTDGTALCAKTNSELARWLLRHGVFDLGALLTD